MLEAPIDHLGVIKPRYVTTLLEAVEAVAVPDGAQAPRALRVVDGGGWREGSDVR